MSEQRESGGAAWAFLLGAAAGVIAGLLIAPRPGKETRKRLQGWLEDLGERGQDIFEEGIDILDQGKEALKEKVDKLKRGGDGGRSPFGGHSES